MLGTVRVLDVELYEKSLSSINNPWVPANVTSPSDNSVLLIESNVAFIAVRLLPVIDTEPVN